MNEHIYLAHHGIKGMKWGVRRFRNEDGTLTEAGKRRYSNTDRLYKDLKKQIHSKRAEEHGGSNRWMVNRPIGERSKAFIEERSRKQRAYESSPEYKEFEKKVRKYEQKAGRQLESGEIDIKQYDDGFSALMKQKPKGAQDFGAKTLTSQGWKYADSYLRGAGRDLSLAYIADLGYSDEVAKQFVDQLLKSGKTLGMD